MLYGLYFILFYFQITHPDLHRKIKSLSSTNDCSDTLTLIRFTVDTEKKRLDKGIALAIECRQAIATFHTRTAVHGARIERKVRLQDNKQRRNRGMVERATAYLYLYYTLSDRGRRLD